MFTLKDRLGTAITYSDADNRSARFGIYGIADSGARLLVAYETESVNRANRQPAPDLVHEPLVALPADVFREVEWAPYRGDEVASFDKVVRYVLSNFTRDDKPLSYTVAHDLVVIYLDEVATAIKLASFAFFPGDKIAEQEGLDAIPIVEEDDDDPRGWAE